MEVQRSILSSEEEADAATTASATWPPAVSIVWRGSGSAPASTRLLLVGARGAGALFCRASMRSAKIVGGVTLNAAADATPPSWPATLGDAAPNARGWACVLAEPTRGVLVLVVCGSTGGHGEGHALWCAIAAAIGAAERIVVFDAQHVGTFANASAAPLHCVATDALRSAAEAAAAAKGRAWRSTQPICPLIRCPNALVGWAATIVTHAQATGVAAAAFVALQSQPTGRLASGDAPTIAAFAPALAQAALAMGGEEDEAAAPPAWCAVDEDGVRAGFFAVVDSVAPTASCSHLYS